MNDSNLTRQLRIIEICTGIGFICGLLAAFENGIGMIFIGLFGGLGLPSLWRVIKWTWEKMKSIVSYFTNEENAGYIAGFLGSPVKPCF